LGAAPASAPPPAAAPYPAPATQPAPGAQPAMQGRTVTDANVAIDGQGPRGTYVQTQDCATNPNQEICQRTTNLDVSSGGLKAGFHQERVTAVKTPPTGSAGLTITGNFLYGTTTKKDNGDLTILGGGAQIGLRLQVGLNRFPGPDGGSWSGFVLQPTFSFQGASVSMKSADGTSSGTSSSLTLLDGGGNIGFELLGFGKLDQSTLKQSGFGVFGGYHAAYSSSTIKSEGSEAISSSDFSQGPVLELLFPDYNAGTAHVQRGYIEVMVLPIKDFLFITAGAGFQF
jgi:hypothetical protein